METDFDQIQLADALAQIASRTHEDDTGRQLMELVDHIVTQAGLPKSPRNDDSKA